MSAIRKFETDLLDLLPIGVQIRLVMQPEGILITVYNKRENVTGVLYVSQLSEHVFRMQENALFNCDLTYGTEFQTRINKEGIHEVVNILRWSPHITRRFFLSAQHRADEYKVLGDELVKRRGFWQVDFGGIATVNIPIDSGIDVDEVMKALDLNLSEIRD